MFYSTPVGTDTFSRIMAEKFQLRNRPMQGMGFMAFFGNTNTGSQTLFTDDATNVAIEVVKPNDKITAIAERGVPLGIDAKIGNGFSAKTSDRLFPIIKGAGSITSTDLLTRQYGETPFTGSLSREERARQIAMDIYYREITGQVWRHELMASQSVLLGKMDANSRGGQFDFQRNSNNTFNAALPWTNSSSTPLTDIDTLCGLVADNGLAEPDFIGMDVASYTAFLNHATVQNYANNRRYEIINIGNMAGIEQRYSRYMRAGWTPRGTMVTNSGYQVVIFTYTKWYKDASGNNVNFMPKGYVFAASTSARFDRYFGPSDKLPENYATNSVIDSFFGIANSAMDAMDEGGDSLLDPRQFMFFATGNEDNTAVKLEVQSAPIYSPTQVDAVALMKVVVV